MQHEQNPEPFTPKGPEFGGRGYESGWESSPMVPPPAAMDSPQVAPSPYQPPPATPAPVYPPATPAPVYPPATSAPAYPPATPAPVYPPVQQQPAYGYAHQPYVPQYLPEPHPLYQPAPMEHPSSTTVLVLGIVGLFMPVLSPVAWYLGHKAKGEVRRGAPYQWGVTGQVGYYLGMAYTLLMVLGVLMFIGLIARF